MAQKTKILIIGNGFGGVYTLKSLGRLFRHDETLELSLIGEKNYFLFTPLLHEVATGSLNPANIIEPIRKVLGCCLKNFYLGRAETIDLDNRTVKAGGNSVAYNYLVLAPGAETNFFNTPGAEKYCFTLKSIEDAVKLKNHCVRQIEKATHTESAAARKKILKFIVVGGGPTGVELAAEMEELVRETFAHYYPKEIIADVSIALMQKAPELVPMFPPKMRQKSLRTLKDKNIEVMLGCGVKAVKESSVLLENGTEIPTETTIWTAGVKPVELNFVGSVEKSPDGRLLVNEYLQLQNRPEVFALGDAALFKQGTAPLPALAQVAEREAKAVAQNIELLIKNKQPEKFYYHSEGNLMSLGKWRAVGDIFHVTFSGHIAWFIWRTIYLSKLISFRKKVRVAADWTMNLFSPRDISEL